MIYGREQSEIWLFPTEHVRDPPGKEQGMKKLIHRIDRLVNRLSIHNKIILLYIFCVIAPLVLLDGVIFYSFYRAEQNDRQHEMEEVKTSIEYTLQTAIVDSMKILNSIDTSSEINDFLKERYETPVDFYTARMKIMENNLVNVEFGGNISTLTIYAENPTIINGGVFKQYSEAKEQPWYDEAIRSGEKYGLYAGYRSPMLYSASPYRRIVLVRRLEYYIRGNETRFAVADLDYSALDRKLRSIQNSYHYYVSEKNGKILFSNDGLQSYTQDFAVRDPDDHYDYVSEIEIYNQKLTISLIRTDFTFFEGFLSRVPVILLVLFLSIAFPVILLYFLDRSFTKRLEALSKAFENYNIEDLKPVGPIDGNDEISSLMRGYNRMQEHSAQLIQTIYKDKIERQEMDLARQNAELLALQSQINPHFLFNTMESIRMHSIIKEEQETADMIEQLAVLTRQNINWKSDLTTIAEEIGFIESYLKLQKYRFGDRLQYKIELAEDCGDFRLPRLTMVTFVENACIHGAEQNRNVTWIFVRIFKKEESLVIEVEDTGGGMDRDQVEEILDKMKNGTIEGLKSGKHVGITNACLRLNMMTGNRAGYHLESEESVGTFLSLRIPLDVLSVDMTDREEENE